MKKLYFFFLALMAMMIWPAGVWAQTDVEALWGTDADNLTHEGSLQEAVYAANAGQASYIQLLQSVTTGDEYNFSGAYAATLDLNGDTIVGSVVIMEGFALSIVDSSEEQTGLISARQHMITVRINNASTFHLYSGKIYSNSIAIFLYENSSSSVNIHGGTLESGENVVIDMYHGNFLNITGGRFVTSSFNLLSIRGEATISGGEFVYDTTQSSSYAIALYSTSTLDFSQYPTTATEGTTPIEEITIYSYDPITVAEAITLPEGYSVLDEEGNVVDMITYELCHIGPTPAPEALWGTDADNLTHEGSLQMAINAANAGQASYIQLQMSMTNSTYYSFSGAYAATLDLNGDTIVGGVGLRDGFTLTIQDSSEGQKGMLSCGEGFAYAVDLYSATTLNLHSGKIFSNGLPIWQHDNSASSVNIHGGTVESGDDGLIRTAVGSFLNITGGYLVVDNTYLFIMNGHATISGGEYVYDTSDPYGNIFFLYRTSTLDLSQYPTTATEGVTPIEEITMYAYYPLIVADALTLPEGYSVLDKDGNMVDVTLSDIYHIGPTPAPQALWGSDADNLTHEGSLQMAVNAANAGQASYIQLLQNVTKNGRFTFSGAYACTLDLNGDTIVGTIGLGDSFILTVLDSSDEQTGLASGYSNGPSTISLFDATIHLHSGKIYNVKHAIYQEVSYNGVANIHGGTVEAGSGYAVYNSAGSVLNITAGRFITGGEYLFITKGYTTISGGEFEYDRTGEFNSVCKTYNTFSLDFSQYPTTATEGTAPIEEMSVTTNETVTELDAITLPEGYCMLDLNGHKAEAIAIGYVYHIGLTPEEKPFFDPEAELVALSDPRHLVGQYQAQSESAFRGVPDEYWDVEITQDATDANKLWIRPIMRFLALLPSEISPVYMLFDPATSALELPVEQVLYENDSHTIVLALIDEETADPTFDHPITPQTYMLHDTLQITITQPMGVSCIKTDRWWFQALDAVVFTKTTALDRPTSVEDINGPSPSANGQKILRDGQLIILRDGKEYNAMGQPLL